MLSGAKLNLAVYMLFGGVATLMVAMGVLGHDAELTVGGAAFLIVNEHRALLRVLEERGKR